MSIAILKKKSRHNPRIDPISGRGHNGFSLNGGYRNIGAVGQFRMISNTTRTPFKGPVAMGSGGCCGKYYNKPLNSGSCCTNDNLIIKKTSLNTSGMIDTKYKWMKGTYPHFWVKEDNGSYKITRDQATYIKNLTQKVGGNVNCMITADLKDKIVSCSANKQACSYHIGGKKYVRMPYSKNYNILAVSQGQYITTGGVAKKYCLPTPANRQPFPMNLNHNSGCQVNYLTWQDARDAGALPDDWHPGYTGNPAVFNRSSHVNPSINEIMIPTNVLETNLNVQVDSSGQLTISDSDMTQFLKDVKQDLVYSTPGGSNTKFVGVLDRYLTKLNN